MKPSKSRLPAMPVLCLSAPALPAPAASLTFRCRTALKVTAPLR